MRVLGAHTTLPCVRAVASEEASERSCQVPATACTRGRGRHIPACIVYKPCIRSSVSYQRHPNHGFSTYESASLMRRSHLAFACPPFHSTPVPWARDPGHAGGSPGSAVADDEAGKLGGTSGAASAPMACWAVARKNTDCLRFLLRALRLASSTLVSSRSIGLPVSEACLPRNLRSHHGVPRRVVQPVETAAATNAFLSRCQAPGAAAGAGVAPRSCCCSCWFCCRLLRHNTTT